MVRIRVRYKFVCVCILYVADTFQIFDLNRIHDHGHIRWANVNLVVHSLWDYGQFSLSGAMLIQDIYAYNRDAITICWLINYSIMVLAI